MSLEDIGLEHASTVPLYNTQAVVQQTNVPAATFRAWERRYGVPKPERVTGGRRLYSERDIAIIRWLNRQTDAGLTASRAVAVLQQRLTNPIPSAPGRGLDQLGDELFATLRAYNAIEAENVLAEAFALHGVERVCLDLLVPLLIRVGDHWHDGELSVTTEHFISAFVRRKVDTLLNLFEDGFRGEVVAIGCAPTEEHELGALMFALLLSRRGWRVAYLGQRVILDGLSDLLSATGASALCLSASNEDSARELGAIVSSLAPRPDAPVLAYGGRIFEERSDLRESVAAHYLGPELAHACDELARLIGRGAN